MPDLSELLAAADAAFVERMRIASDDAAAKSKELSDQAEAMLGRFVEKFTAMIGTGIKIESIQDRSGGNPGDRPEAGEKP